MKFREIDKKLRDKGWYLESAEGSHHHYIHDEKPGKITVPYHSGDIPKRVENNVLKKADAK